MANTVASLFCCLLAARAVFCAPPASQAAKSKAADSEALVAVLADRPDDPDDNEILLVFSPENLISRCSRALADTHALSAGARAKLHQARARAYLRLGKLQMAVSDLDAAVTLDPTYRKARVLRAAVKLCVNEDPPTSAELNVLGREYADEPVVLNAIAMRELNAGHNRAVLTWCGKSIAADGRNLLARKLRAKANYMKGAFAECLRDADYYLDHQPVTGGSDQSEMYRIRGVALDRLGQRRAAVANYFMASQVDPTDPEPVLQICKIYLKEKRYALAEVIADRLVNSFPTSAPANISKAMVLTVTKRYEPALVSTTRAIALDPSAADYYATRGFCFKELGRCAEGVTAYEAALKRNPRQRDAMVGLALILATCPQDSIRDAPRAVKVATAACRLSATPEAYAQSVLAVAYAECGDIENATRAAKEALQCAADEDKEAVRTLIRAIKDPELRTRGKAGWKLLDPH